VRAKFLWNGCTSTNIRRTSVKHGLNVLQYVFVVSFPPVCLAILCVKLKL
jgi:hypothetical protein